MATFQDRLILLKEFRGVSWSDIARAVNVDRSCMNHYANGRHKPNSATLVALAVYFHVNAEWLAGKDVPLQGADTEELIELYDKLNEEGRKKALDLLADYASMPRYTREECADDDK